MVKNAGLSQTADLTEAELDGVTGSNAAVFGFSSVPSPRRPSKTRGMEVGRK
jgi:hypothetical protein